MAELQQLRAGHADAVLAFERANRAWFAASISDRGDEFFERFPDGFRALLADQDAGHGAYYVLVDPDGAVLGRFNLFLDAGTGDGGPGDGVANLGYRVAQHVAGQGLATAAVLELCPLAASRHGVHTLRAATSHGNVASQRVLVKAGFVPVGPAGPADLGGKTGTWYERAAEPSGD
jgi:[ribosomal protein S5]-alanine N-acetyltransferase